MILLGRNRKPVGDQVRAVLGIRGEPTTPDDPAQGLVWRSIVEHLDNAEVQNEFVSVTNVDRATFGKHPWSMGGGGAAGVERANRESGCDSRLGGLAVDIGFGAVTREDDVFSIGSTVARRQRIASEQIRPLVEGDDYATGAFGESNECYLAL